MSQAQTFQKPYMFQHTVTSAEASATTLDIQISPVSNDERDLIFIVGVVSSAGVEKTGFSTTYSKTTGKLTVANASDATLVTGDIVTVLANLGVLA